MPQTAVASTQFTFHENLNMLHEMRYHFIDVPEVLTRI